MESTEAIQHTLHLLKNDYFIDEVELSHTIGKDFWLGKTGLDQREWLASEWHTSLRLAEEKIENSVHAAEKNRSELLLR